MHIPDHRVQPVRALVTSVVSCACYAADPEWSVGVDGVARRIHHGRTSARSRRHRDESMHSLHLLLLRIIIVAIVVVASSSSSNSSGSSVGIRTVAIDAVASDHARAPPPLSLAIADGARVPDGLFRRSPLSAARGPRWWCHDRPGRLRASASGLRPPGARARLPASMLSRSWWRLYVRPVLLAVPVAFTVKDLVADVATVEGRSMQVRQCVRSAPPAVLLLLLLLLWWWFPSCSSRGDD